MPRTDPKLPSKHNGNGKQAATSRPPISSPPQQTIKSRSNGKETPHTYKVKPNGKAATGKPSNYNPKYAQMAEVMMREHGFTEAELARALATNVPTLKKWCADNEEFALAIKEGKDKFDVTKVQEALRSRALGYEYDETEEGFSAKSGAYEKIFHKKLAPDITAAIFWLVNRNPERWKHLARTIVQGDPKNPVKYQHSGEVKHTVEDMGIVNDPARAAEVARILKASGAFEAIAGTDTPATTH